MSPIAIKTLATVGASICGALAIAFPVYALPLSNAATALMFWAHAQSPGTVKANTTTVTETMTVKSPQIVPVANNAPDDGSGQ